MTFHGAYGFLNVNRTVLALTFFALRIESQPERLASSHCGLMIVFHVKIRSLAVNGLPSLHFAFLLILASSVNGFFFSTFALPM